jgi:hypothetical protein
MMITGCAPKNIKPTFVVEAVVDTGSPVYYWLALKPEGLCASLLYS